MALSYAIVAFSGFGKSTAIGKNEALGIEGLDLSKTAIVNIMGKALPIRGWKKHMKPCKMEIQGGKYVITQRGNYFASRKTAEILTFLSYINTVEACKHVVIDDLQYIMGDQYMEKALQKGWDKFNVMAKDLYDVITYGRKMRPDMTFGVLTHADVEKDGDIIVGYKIKTIGKLLDEKISLEGLFTVLLFGDQTRVIDSESGKAVVKKFFVTNYDGKFDKAKSPHGMFETLHIPNDLGFVTKKMLQYESGE